MAPKHTTRWTAWWLFGLVACVYLATHQGPTAGDDVVHYESGRALVLGQKMALSPERFDLKSYPSLKIFARQGLSGGLYMTMAPGLSVVTAPLCAVGLGMEAATGGVQTPAHLFQKGTTMETMEANMASLRALPSMWWMTLGGPIIMALVAATLFGFAADLSGSRRRGALVALVGAFGTMMWPYGITFWTQPLAALGLLLAFWLAWRQGKPLRNEDPGAEPSTDSTTPTQTPVWEAGLAGAALGLACAARYDCALMVPWVVVVLLARIWPSRRWSAVVAVGAALALCAAVLMAWNVHRFGSPWDTGGYHQSLKHLLRFDSLPEAMAFNLLSFNQGLLFFNPPLIVAMVGLGALWRHQRSLLVAIAGAGVVSWVFYSAFVFWNVTVGWGPRFLMPMVPLLLLPLATLGQSPKHSPELATKATSIPLAIATVVGVVFSIIAASSPLDNETIMALMGSRQDSLWVQALESEVFLKAHRLGLGHIELGWVSAQQAPWMVVLLSLGALGCAWKMKENLQQ